VLRAPLLVARRLSVIPGLLRPTGIYTGWRFPSVTGSSFLRRGRRGGRRSSAGFVLDLTGVARTRGQGPRHRRQA
jgi:hypothetical protein